MMNIRAINANPICFKGYVESSEIPKNEGVEKRYHFTYFMRDFETLNFTQKYIKKHFPRGTDIAEFGCSQGQKPYSLLVLLDDANKDKKYKITGYDCAEVIDSTKRGFYKIDAREAVLSGNPKLSKKFYEYFNKVSADDLDLMIKNEQKPDALEEYSKAKVHCYLSPGVNYVTPKKEKTEGRIDFKVGDIRNISHILEPKKAGVVIFQNALYHIIGNHPSEKYNSELHPVKSLFEKIHKELPDNGIFVMGHLPEDHMWDPLSLNTKLIYQDNKRIEVCNDTLIHHMLKKVGFEPVFYEKNNWEIALPSVWKKISHKI